MTPRTLGRMILGLLVGLGLGSSARGQGFIVDRHHWPTPVPVNRSYEIREVAIDARVRDQVAEVQVSQTFHNPGSTQIDAEYLFPLPDDAGVQNFVLMVDGREMPGRLLPKDEARRIYEEIVRTKRDPALLEYMGRGLFRTSVFPIPPGADRKVTLRYTQLCKRDRDVVEFVYPLAHPEAFLEADPEAQPGRCGSKVVTRSSRSTARPTTRRSLDRASTRSGRPWNGATSCPRPTSASSTPWPKGRSGRRS